MENIRENIKFAHLADIHLGGWRQEELKKLNLDSFKFAINQCINEKVNFILIAGDLFDTAMPSLDTLTEAVSELRKLKEKGIKVYFIAGSHDFSLSGKTFLQVIEGAGLGEDVFILDSEESNKEEFPINLIVNQESKLVLAGIPGKKASMEIPLFKKLKINQLELDKYRDYLKIFMFHTTLTESKPKGMDVVESVDLKDIPDGFDYYAAGHLHLTDEHEKVFFNKKGKLIYPGPIFPNNLEELEKLGKGSFYICNFDFNNKVLESKKIDISLKDIISIKIDINNLNPQQSNLKILGTIKNLDIKDKIVVLRLEGCLTSGKTSDINFAVIEDLIKEKQAYSFLRSNKITTPELNIEITKSDKEIEDLEKEVIEKYEENAGDFKEFTDLIPIIIQELDLEKIEGEKNSVFESRVLEIASKLFDMKLE